MGLRHVVGALALAFTVGAGSAYAQYPPTVGAGRVSRSELKQCQCTQFSGGGFQPGTMVTIVDVDPVKGEHVETTTTADAKGEFRVKVCFDENASPGEHTLVARGTGTGGTPHEDRATVRVDGTVCFRREDEVHNPSDLGTVDEEEEPRTGTGSGPGFPRGGSGSSDGGSSADGGSALGPEVGGVTLPRTGAGYVVPGLLVGFTLVMTGTGVVHVTRRRRLVTG